MLSLKKWFQSAIRVTIIGFICGLLSISSIFPAQAATSKPSDGTTSLNRIQKETDEMAKQDPPSLKEVTERSQAGLNEVQAGADRDKMISPEDAKGTETVKDQTENFLDKILN
jgi:hypothetical protein